MARSTQSISRNLPKGWRFAPTDIELVYDYLKQKMVGDPIDGSDIKEINLCDYNPHDLFGLFSTKSGEKDLYFLSPKEFCKNGTLRKRKVRGGGTWKCTGEPRLITHPDSGEVVGTKRSLVYSNGDATNMVLTEYDVSARLLDRPTVEPYVIYKLPVQQLKAASASAPKNKDKDMAANLAHGENEQHEHVAPGLENLKATNKKRMKGDPYWKKPNKKARKGELLNCNSAPASTFQNKNKDVIGNSAYGDPIQSWGSNSDSQNQYLHIRSNSTYEKGESSYPKLSDFYNQNVDEMIFTLASVRGATSSPMDSDTGILDFDQVTTVSTDEKGDMRYKAVFDLGNHIPDKIINTSLDCADVQSLFEMTTVSSHNKRDENNFIVDFDHRNENRIDMSTEILYDNDKENCVSKLDFGIQNPCKSMDIPEFEEGKRSPLTGMSSDFDNQNQCQKNGVSLQEDNESLSIGSEVGESTIQEVPSGCRKIFSKSEDCPGPLKPSHIGETASRGEVRSQYCTNMTNLLDNLNSDVLEDATYSMIDPKLVDEMVTTLKSVFQQPIHTDEIPNFNDNVTQNHHCESDIPTLGENQGLSAASVEEKLMDGEQLEELLACFY